VKNLAVFARDESHAALNGMERLEVAPDQGLGMRGLSWGGPEDCSKRLTRGCLIPTPSANAGLGNPNGRQSSLT